MRLGLIAFLFLSASVAAISIGDQIALYGHEGENQTSVNFYVSNSSYYLLFSNCIPTVILEEQAGELTAAGPSKTYDILAEYLQRGYRGCENEVLDFNASLMSILSQYFPRQVEAEGRMAAISRAEDLSLLGVKKQGLLMQANQIREFEFVALDAKITELSGILWNLRRVKTRNSISTLSSQFDVGYAEANALLADYARALPYYYPAAAAYANASISLRNAQKRYGAEDPWLKSIEHSLIAVDAELTALEKGMAAGAMPDPSEFSKVALESNELQKKISQRGPMLPWFYIYVVIFVVVAALGLAVAVRLRTPKKIAEEDVPKIQKYLAKLRGIEQQEEEMK